MSHLLIVPLGVAALDAMGVGLIMPVLPALLREFLPDGAIAWHYAALLSLYALMQVGFAPFLGRLSDRHGRRPVLLLSLAGAALDYTVMALAPVFWVLYAGRALAGVTAATGAVVAATVADVTPADQRARAFGLMSACFGAGLIAGPALGGLLGSLSPRAPFAGAAILNGLGGVLTWVWLKETRPGGAGAVRVRLFQRPSWPQLSGGLCGLGGLLVVFFILQFAGQAPATLWVIYGEDRFLWDSTRIGLSLAAFGATHTLLQAGLTGPLVQRLGETRVVMLGMAADALGLVLLALSVHGAMMLPILVLLATGGVGVPALQARLSRAVAQERQGALQGSLARLTHLSGVIGPLVFGALYAATAPFWNGWAWLAAAACYGLCLPALRHASRAP